MRKFGVGIGIGVAVAVAEYSDKVQIAIVVFEHVGLLFDYNIYYVVCVLMFI